jgi:hypothetical protein
LAREKYLGMLENPKKTPGDRSKYLGQLSLLKLSSTCLGIKGLVVVVSLLKLSPKLHRF